MTIWHLIMIGAAILLVVSRVTWETPHEQIEAPSDEPGDNAKPGFSRSTLQFNSYSSTKQ